MTGLWEDIRRALAARPPRRVREPALIPSAVLVPLYHERSRLRILLAERPEHLARHGGQIAFPGGVIEPGDEDATATALRETEEEIGLARSSVEVLGELDETMTGQGFRIAPFVARVELPLRLSINQDEITRTLTPAFDEFCRTDNVWHETREYRGKEYRLSFYRCDDGVVWGATARIIENLRDRMREAGIVP